MGLDVNGTSIDLQTAPSVIHDGSPHRISLTYDPAGDQIELFIDGTLASSISASITPITTNGTLIFGQTQGVVGGGFIPTQILRGDVADVRIWNDLRTAQEIADNAFTEIANPMTEQGLVNNWRPDGNMFTIPDAAGGAPLGLFGSPQPSNFGVGGDDILDGGTGADEMSGGSGNDRYFVDNVGDVVIENPGEGIADYIFSTVSYTNAANAERLYLEGTANINATGLDGQADILLGNSGNNHLDGRGGTDLMRGGLGNDFYYVDNAADIVDETFGGGGLADYIFSTVSYTSAANVERLYLTGSASIDATGVDGQTDILLGNSGNNDLDGRGGADVMRGGLGNDFYFVDNAGDSVDEVIGGGGVADYIFSTVSYTTTSGIERLYLEGTANIDATGRDGGADILIGNSGNNRLDGMGGVDVMRGGMGDDTYFVDAATDVVDEVTGGGGSADYIFTTSPYQIAAGVERLIAVEGANAVGLTARNNQNDIIIGNSGTNVFIDQFGRDIFIGGGGADFFRFIANLDSVNNVNRINDFDATDDQFQLLQLVYTEIDIGILDASEFVLGTAAGDADDRIIYDSPNGVLYYDPDGTGAIAQIEIVNVTAGVTITADDFHIY